MMVRNLSMILLLLLVAAGCKLTSEPDSLPFEDDRYISESVANVESRLDITDYTASQEIRLNGGSLSDLAEFFRVKTDKSLISNADDLKISGLYVGTPREIARAVGLAYNLKFFQVGNTFFLLQDVGSDTLNAAVSIRSDVSVEELSKMYPDVKLSRRDCMIIASGDFNSLLALQDYLDVVNAVAEQNYVITVVEIESSLDFALDLQLEIQSKGVDLLRPGVTAYDVFSAYARARGQSINADNYHERQLVATSGQKTTYTRSTEKKLEQRAISDAGTSTVSGYEDVEAGIILDLTVNSVNDDYVSLSYNLEISQFVGSTLDKTSVKVNSDKVLVCPDRLYYIASSEDRMEEKGGLLVGLTSLKQKTVSTIFVKISKIAK